MNASIQKFIQEFNVVIFEKHELLIRDMSELKVLLPLLAYQDSNSNVEIIFQDTYKRPIRFRCEAIDIDNLMEKKASG